MTEKIPTSKWQRGLRGSRTAAKMGQKTLTYLVRKPFLKEEERVEKKKALNRENAAVLFEGLSLLKGTALKIAQMLSMEMDIFPPEITKELQKSYHQVPPINRAPGQKNRAKKRWAKRPRRFSIPSNQPLLPQRVWDRSIGPSPGTELNWP